MGLIVGGPRAWKVAKKGNVVRAYHWVNGEPAMVLFPAQKKIGAAAFVICLSAAHLYARADGYPTEYLVKQSITAAKVMAMDTERSTLRNIADVILDGMEDLIKMPPEPTFPTARGRPVGQIKVISEGKVVTEAEVDMPSHEDLASLEIDAPGMKLH